MTSVKRALAGEAGLGVADGEVLAPWVVSADSMAGLPCFPVGQHAWV